MSDPWTTRRARARAFLESKPKKGRPWTDQIYDYEEAHMHCQHADCPITQARACFAPGSETPDAWYCLTHAPLHGFCCGCGELRGGEEDFENNRDGLCDLCASEKEHTEAMDRRAMLRDGEWI